MKLAVLPLVIVLITCLINYASTSSFESCITNSEYALVGDLLQYNSNSGMCNISSGSTHQNNGMRVYLPQPGIYQYECQNDSINLTVVSTQYRVGLCSDCQHQDLVIRRGQLIHWFAMKDFNCTSMRLVSEGGCQGDIIEAYPDKRGIYIFNTSGLYQLVCGHDDDCRQLATVTVLKEEEGSTKYKELIYTHAVIMAITFGLVFPFGALLAHLRKPVVHMIVQPLGCVLTVGGFLMAVVYKEINSTTHFNQLHTVFGLLLTAVALIVLPGLKLSVMTPVGDKWQKLVKLWHQKLGVVAIFSGIFNIFLGLSVLPGAPSYVLAIYGLWAIVIIVIFVVTKKRRPVSGDLNDEESVLAFCCHYKADEMELTRRDSLPPSKLSHDPFAGGNFVQVRKKSVDMLEMKTQVGNGVPQRKTSNVHFGPVAIAAQLTPVPQTPMDNNNSTQFGFVNQLTNHYGEDAKTSNNNENNDSQESESDSSESESESESSIDGGVTINVDKGSSNNDSRFSLNSIASSGGSVRITRHSERAKIKVDELFPPNNSRNSSRLTSPLVLSTKSDISDEEKQRKEVSPENYPPQSCPFSGHNGGGNNTYVPLQQRRMRKNAFTAALCDEDERLKLQQQQQQEDEPQKQEKEQPEIRQPSPQTLPVRRPLQRGLSRNASFRRKQEMVDHTLRSVMEMSDNAIICANSIGEIVFWSAGAMKMFGYTPGEAIGSSIQIVMPQKFREKHQNGLNNRAEKAKEYIKKHQCAPEDHKHARLYAVTGQSKTGKEFEVEVVVTSFVIEGDIFFTGIISETKGLTRHMSASSISSEVEIREKQQKALAIGAQMKIAHKLRSADHMSKNELTKILKSSLRASQFEVPPEDITVMVDGIVKAADADESGIIKFVDLIGLLVKHGLYISESGFIAKYGKSKTSEKNNTAPKKCCSSVVNFFSSQAVTICWGLVYLIVNILLVIMGVLSTPKTAWSKWAYGTGPVLSFNCVLILLPMLKSLIHNMRGSLFFNKILPLRNGMFFHCLISAVILAWTIVHIATHLCSFSFDNLEDNSTIPDNLTSNLMTHLVPIITGVLTIVILVVILISSSIKLLSTLCLFIGFHTIHWFGFIFMYIMLIIHGTNGYNPSFWKWLLPVAVVYVLERVYFRWVVPRYTVKIIKSAPYDDTSRTTKVEIQKPPHYNIVTGQYLLINMPQVGYFNWQPCYVSSIKKEKTLTLYYPHAGTRWFEKAYNTFKRKPIKSLDGTPSRHTVSITAPFGTGVDHIFDYKAVVLLCGGGEGLPTCRSVIQKLVQYRKKGSHCQCGMHPLLTKLYFVWVTPSGNDNEWFTDFLTELTEDEHIKKYLDIRIFLTNIDSPPDELASALLHLALKTGGPALSVRRPSQPQLSKLYPNTSYGIPDFESLLDFVAMQQGTSEKEVECGVFTIGSLPVGVIKDLVHLCNVCSKKKGPSVVSSPTINSPFRKISSPQPDAPPPTEWHITFKYQPIIL